LRCEVFTIEQAHIFAEVDGNDLRAYHVMCYETTPDTACEEEVGMSRELVAYARFFKPDDYYPHYGALSRVVTRPSRRGEGYGKALVRKSIEYYQSVFKDEKIGLKIGAQTYLRAFYESFGFVAVSEDLYFIEHLEHIDMVFEALQGE